MLNRIVFLFLFIVVTKFSYGQRRDAIDLLWKLSDQIMFIKIENEKLTSDVSINICRSIVEGTVIEILKSDSTTAGEKHVRFSRLFECDDDVSFENGHKLDMNKKYIVFLITKVVYSIEGKEYQATADDFLAIQPVTSEFLTYLRQKKKAIR